MRALRDAPRKDGGFSPLTLAWLVRDFPVEELGEAAGLDAGARAELRRFRDSLVERLLVLPPGS